MKKRPVTRDNNDDDDDDGDDDDNNSIVFSVSVGNGRVFVETKSIKALGS